VYLDSIHVAPRGYFETYDEWGWFKKSEDFEDGIRDAIEDIFKLPHITSESDVRKTDLGLQVVVLKYQGGEFDFVNINSFVIPFFWRPKIEIRSRLYYLKSQKTFSEFKIVEKVSLSNYLKRLISINGLILRYKPLYNKEDMVHLLLIGSITLINKMRSKL
jgi:hypothetical protein